MVLLINLPLDLLLLVKLVVLVSASLWMMLMHSQWQQQLWLTMALLTSPLMYVHSTMLTIGQKFSTNVRTMSEIRNLESIFVPTLDPTHFVWPIHILLVLFCLFIFRCLLHNFTLFVKATRPSRADGPLLYSWAGEPIRSLQKLKPLSCLNVYCKLPLCLCQQIEFNIKWKKHLDWIFSFAAVFRDVTQRYIPKDGCEGDYVNVGRSWNPK